LVLAEHVFKNFPEANEGLLNNYYQKYVNQDFLSQYSKKICLSRFIKTQKGDNLEENKSILSDVVESIIGAIYLDSNLINCKKFIINEIIYEDIISSKPIKHPKSILQEHSLNKYKSLPNYEVINKSGDDHNPIYTVSVKITNFNKVLGSGSNLKSAEQDAALRLLDILKIDIC
jgi:ribonuclease-3